MAEPNYGPDRKVSTTGGLDVTVTPVVHVFGVTVKPPVYPAIPQLSIVNGNTHVTWLHESVIEDMVQPIISKMDDNMSERMAKYLQDVDEREQAREAATNGRITDMEETVMTLDGSVTALTGAAERMARAEQLMLDAENRILDADDQLAEIKDRLDEVPDTAREAALSVMSDVSSKIANLIRQMSANAAMAEASRSQMSASIVELTGRVSQLEKMIAAQPESGSTDVLGDARGDSTPSLPPNHL
ncbi:LO4 protein [Japanese eel endothelial cells-infecting virus]|uniref:LO4 protein n=1 Tax=Japanese eel endothelial cells-infecting virus TaxID=712037 RepID=UPI00052E4A3D|nr:LO4 protein [Japanese eel endothelial cells-infecting virus]